MFTGNCQDLRQYAPELLNTGVPAKGYMLFKVASCPSVIAGNWSLRKVLLWLMFAVDLGTKTVPPLTSSPMIVGLLHMISQ